MQGMAEKHFSISTAPETAAQEANQRPSSSGYTCVNAHAHKSPATPSLDKHHRTMHHHYLMSTSRRSPVLCRYGCVACNQPLAADAGISLLKRGGNAADAAVAVAAALNVTQPCSTGLGGDCFCLFYDAATRSVRGINGR